MDEKEEATGQAPVNEPESQGPDGGREEERRKTFDTTYVEKLRKENAGYRHRLKELETQVSGLEEAQLSEAEKLRSQAQAAQEELRRARSDAALARAAAKHGVDASLVTRLVDVEFGEDGQPAGVEEAVAALLEQHPYLKPAVSPSMNSTNPQRRSALTLDEIKRMSPDEVNARWDEVQAVLKTGR